MFKCVGSVKEHHYQESLAEANRKIWQGETVQVRLFPEPENPYDSHAIAVQVFLEPTWKRVFIKP